MKVEWLDGFVIKAVAEKGEIVISENREGLVSLAAHMVLLANEETGSHIHYDDANSLENGSAELIIERIQ